MRTYKIEDYIEDCKKTELKDYEEQIKKVNKSLLRLNHAIVGISTEAGEMLDAIKKHIYYDAVLDKVNLEEEAGDILYYLAIMFDELSLTFEQVMGKNIKKLKARYPDNFTKKKALVRDLKKERKILESESNLTTKPISKIRKSSILFFREKK